MTTHPEDAMTRERTLEEALRRNRMREMTWGTAVGAGAALAILAVLIVAELRHSSPLNQPPPRRSCVTADCKW